MMPNRSEEEKKIIFGIFAFRPIGSFPQTKTIAEEKVENEFLPLKRSCYPDASLEEIAFFSESSVVLLPVFSCRQRRQSNRD